MVILISKANINLFYMWEKFYLCWIENLIEIQSLIIII